MSPPQATLANYEKCFDALDELALAKGRNLLSVVIGMHGPERGMAEPEMASALAQAGIVLAIPLLFAGALEILGLMSLLSARAIGAHRQRTLVLVTAALYLVLAPFGTALGVFAVVVLSRPAVRAAFEAGGRAVATSGFGAT